MIVSLLWRSLLMALLFVGIRKWFIKQTMKQLDFVHMISLILIGFFSFDYIFHTARPFVFTFIFILFWSLFPLLINWINVTSQAFRNWYTGKEVLIIKDGKILEEELKRMNLPAEQMLSMLRERGYFQIASLKRVYVEPTGELTVLPMKYHEEMVTVIKEGEIKDSELAKRGLNRRDVLLQLNQKGIPLDNVFLGQLDDYGALHLDLFDDALEVPKDTKKEELVALLKATIADVETYALDTDNKQAKEMYLTMAKKLEYNILKKLPKVFVK